MGNSTGGLIGMIAIYLSFLVAYRHAQTYKYAKSDIAVGITSLVSFLIGFQLVLDIGFYRSRILPGRVYIVATAPKFAVSVCKLHIPEFLEYHQTTLPLQISHKSRNAHFGWYAHQ